MERRTIGKFLLELRREKGYTQQQVADYLFVSNKTISKWECDNGYPEIIILPQIAELYDVTVEELLQGERNKTVESTEELDKYTNQTQKRALSLFVILSGSIATVLSYFANDMSQASWICRFISLLLIISSVIGVIISSNNYLSQINHSSVSDKSINEVKNNINHLSSYEMFFILANFTVTAINIADVDGKKLYALIAIAISFIATLSVCFVFNRRNLSIELAELQKKSVIFTFVPMLIISILICTIPYVIAHYDEDVYTAEYDFLDYLDAEAAYIEYNNLRDYFEKGEFLLYMQKLYANNVGGYFAQGEVFNHVIGKSERGYYIKEYMVTISTYNLGNEEQANSFIGNNTISVDLTEILKNSVDICFSDKECVFTYKYTKFINILPDYYISCSAAILVLIAAINFTVYKRKSKLLSDTDN